MSAYTDEQIEQFSRAIYRVPASSVGPSSAELLTRLTEAGITVTFPKPRFYVGRHPSGSSSWCVYDRTRENASAARAVFNNPDAERHASEFADRLNREVSS